MVQYYYDRYAINATPTYTDSAPWSALDNKLMTFEGLYKSFTFNSTTNTYVGSGGQYSSNDKYLYDGTVGYAVSGSTVTKYTMNVSGPVSASTAVNTFFTVKDASSNQSSTSYSRGSLVQALIAAEEGTYPANGRHTDGYWYVKGAAAGPLPPGMVINQPYSTAGNGGRKLVRLNDGTLICAVIETTTPQQIRVYRSEERGTTWKLVLRYTINAVTDLSMVSLGNKYGLMWKNNTSVVFVTANKDGGEQGSVILDSAQSTVGNVSLAIDPTNGHLHAAWASKNAAYPNSFNIRYAKSTDGGVTWSTVEQITKESDSNKYTDAPSIAVLNGKPFILARYKNLSTYFISCFVLNGSNWVNNPVHSQSTTYQLKGPSVAVDKNGVMHVTWGASVPTDSYSHPMYSNSSDGVVWSAVKTLIPGNDPTITVDKNNKLSILAVSPTGGIIQFENNGSKWSDKIVPSTAMIGSLNYVSSLYDNNFITSFGDTPPAIFQTSTDVRYIGSYTTNSAPTVTLTSPSNNQTLYENDTINISGDTYDADKDQSVTVFYQVNSEQRKVLATNISQTLIALSKQLTFKGGKLYDGDTAITGTLVDGVAHTLKVWAVDSENESSAVVERTFYVVPNRAPLLSVDVVEPAGVVDADKFKISGTSSDLDANSNVTVTHRINAGNAVEIYNGPGGAWEFEISLAQLVVGVNTIVIEVIDNYGAKTSKTIKLNKNEIKTPILHAVARYNIKPPAGTAKGVLLFIERDEDMDLKVELSMTLAGEQEQYEMLTPSNTAPMPNTNNIVEDTFYHETTEPKDNIILKLSTTRPDATVNHKIHLISGAVE